MDNAQDMLRRLKSHRFRAVQAPAAPVLVACWKCGEERMAPRAASAVACACGGVFAEPATHHPEGDGD